MGGGYPGSAGCNDVIPHAKWHAQSAASLSDMTKLVDFVLKLEKKQENSQNSRLNLLQNSTVLDHKLYM